MERVLRELGYRLPNQAVQETLVVEELFRGNYRPLQALCRKYDAFQDMPFSQGPTYAIVDSMFPGSKFILTVRDSDAWFDSLVRFHLGGILAKAGVSKLEEFNEAAFKGKAIHLHENYLYNVVKRHASLLGGCDLSHDWSLVYDRSHRKSRYECRNQDIASYFQDRPNQLLILDVSKEENTGKIVEFLGLPSSLVRPMPRLKRTN